MHFKKERRILRTDFETEGSLVVNHSLGKTFRSYAIITAMACVMGVNYELFVFPNAFAPSGVNGLATMVQYVFHISVGWLSLVINLPLILLTWKKLAPGFARRSLLFVVVFSIITVVMNQMDLRSISYHTGYSGLLGPVMASVISGAVYGVVLRQNSSTGGTDIVAAWIHKLHPEANLVWVIFGLNASVALLSFFVYGRQFEPVILCLIYCYISSRISDGILKGYKTALKFEVVTQHADALSTRLLQELHHGVTVIPAQGMYSETPRGLLICVVNRHQIVRFQEILSEFPDAFACVSSVNETLGNFKRIPA